MTSEEKSELKEFMAYLTRGNSSWKGLARTYQEFQIRKTAPAEVEQCAENCPKAEALRVQLDMEHREYENIIARRNQQIEELREEVNDWKRVAEKERKIHQDSCAEVEKWKAEATRLQELGYGYAHKEGTVCQNKEEELAVLQVRLHTLTTAQIKAVFGFVMKWKEEDPDKCSCCGRVAKSGTCYCKQAGG